MYPSASRSTTSTALTTWCVAAIYNNIGSPTFGAAKIGLVARMAFISSSPAVAVGDRSRILKFPTHHQDPSMEYTSNEGKGVHLHTLVDRERKRSNERG